MTAKCAGHEMFDLGRGLLASVRRMPDAIAISDGERSWRYHEWWQDIERVAAGLARLGIAHGDHVVTMLQNRSEAATLHLACQVAGYITTPVNWRASAEELDYVLADAGARALVFEAATTPAVHAANFDNDVLCIGIDTVERGAEDWNALLADEPLDVQARARAQDTSIMLYTSGTTGRGKGVPRSHAAERAAAIAHVAQNQYARGEITLGVMPLYHTMGVRSLLTSILVNGHFVCQRRFDPGEALALIARHRISNLYLVPTLYHDLLHRADFASADVSSVRKLGFAGQAMTAGLLEELQHAFRPELFVNHYGSSEIYTFTTEPDAVAKPGSAGKAGLNQEIRVIELGSDDPRMQAGTAQEGQIIASLDGDESFQGYWNRPDADARAVQRGAHGNWYFTGDIGYFDAHGDLFVTGRVDDMIISGGENILPVEIESALSLHPAVSEVAVVGLPDARWGQQVTAFVARRASVTERELEAWLLDSDLAAFKRPRRYVFVTAVPKSPVGKILRRKLVDGDFIPA